VSWVTVIWSMIATVCLTVGGTHLYVWCRQRLAWGSLFIALSVMATGLLAAFEFAMMQAETTAQYGVALRWLHVPTWILTVSLVGFVHFQLRAGRPWLAWTFVVLRTLSLLINFIVTPNINYSEITSLEQIPFLGETVAIPHGIANPWMVFAQATLLLLLVFVVDAAHSIWRRGDRRQSLLMGGSIVFFVLLGTLQAILVFWNVIAMPITASLFYVGIVLVMALESSRDMFRVTQLAGDLHDSEYRMALAAETAHLGVWMRDVGHREVWASETWRELFGFGKAEELDLDSIVLRLHPDDREVIQQAQAEALATGGRYDTEFRVVLPGGQVRWIASRGAVMRTGDGRSTRVHGVSIDITQRKLAEERFRLAVEATPNAMVIVDTEGNIILLNAQAESVFGYSRAELLGRPIETLIPERHHARAASYRRQYLSAPSARSLGVGQDLHGRRKDGSEVLLEIALNPISMPEGMAVLASIVDITARRRSEAEVALQRNELAHLSRVTMLGELSGSLAHELNQPLMAILSNAQAGLRFLERDPGNIEEVRHILEDIAENDKRAGEVIRRLRSLFKKDAVHHAPLDVNHVVLDVLKLMHSDLLNRKVIASSDLAVGLPWVDGDRVQLQQVVLNLIMNGCDAMDGVDREHRLTLRTRLWPGGEIEIAVMDCGTGIPPGDLEQIFTPFNSTKEDGMGLGLAVCRTIVSAHGGRLWATNNADHGATLHVALPAQVTA
jgi:two-component system, LuxR family, sensor kinase FixL